MTIKRIFISYAILLSVGFTLSSFAENDKEIIPQQAANKVTAEAADNRISLNLSPKLKIRQLTKMRSHFKSIQSVVRLIGEEEFIEASTIVDKKMVGKKGKKKLSDLIDNDSFKLMGAAFHDSAAALSETLKTKDTKKSLEALNATMNHCTQCHEVFRQ